MTQPVTANGRKAPHDGNLGHTRFQFKSPRSRGQNLGVQNVSQGFLSSRYPIKPPGSLHADTNNPSASIDPNQVREIPQPQRHFEAKFLRKLPLAKARGLQVSLSMTHIGQSSLFPILGSAKAEQQPSKCGRSNEPEMAFELVKTSMSTPHIRCAGCCRPVCEKIEARAGFFEP
jgi:hypothetical protein